MWDLGSGEMKESFGPGGRGGESDLPFVMSHRAPVLKTGVCCALRGHLVVIFGLPGSQVLAFLKEAVNKELNILSSRYLINYLEIFFRIIGHGRPAEYYLHTLLRAAK